MKKKQKPIDKNYYSSSSCQTGGFQNSSSGTYASHNNDIVVEENKQIARLKCHGSSRGSLGTHPAHGLAQRGPGTEKDICCERFYLAFIWHSLKSTVLAEVSLKTNWLRQSVLVQVLSFYRYAKARDSIWERTGNSVPKVCQKWTIILFLHPMYLKIVQAGEGKRVERKKGGEKQKSSSLLNMKIEIDHLVL